MSYIVLKPFLYFVQGDIIEEATDETKSADYTLLPNEIKIALELGGVVKLTIRSNKKVNVIKHDGGNHFLGDLYP